MHNTRRSFLSRLDLCVGSQTNVKNPVSRRSLSLGGTNCQVTFDILIRTLGELAALMPELDLYSACYVPFPRVYCCLGGEELCFHGEG